MQFVMYRALTEARKTCNKVLDDCKRIVERDPLLALTEKDSLLSRVEDAQNTNAGLSFQPIITPHIHSHRDLGAMERLPRLLEGISAELSLEDDGDHEREDEEEGEEDECSDYLATSAGGYDLKRPSLHAQDTQHNTDPTSLEFANLPKLDFVVNTPPSLPSQASTPASFMTPSDSHQSPKFYPTQQRYSPASSNSEDNDSPVHDEYKVLHLRQPLPFLMSPNVFPGHHGYRPHSHSTRIATSPPLRRLGFVLLKSVCVQLTLTKVIITS